ncbi:hypothetical protein ABT127_03145 [Streptomyces sp. NPDC001904]|uniref:hypothetical protein n=1 Tax=Streptomyces sp. NPDC001904 TaxID=3154531 RepID=UPI003320B0FB
MPMYKNCVNCKGPLQPFRHTVEAEQIYLIKEKELSPAEANGFWRCQGMDGACRRVQHHLNQSEGYTLPEELA